MFNRTWHVLEILLYLPKAGMVVQDSNTAAAGIQGDLGGFPGGGDANAAANILQGGLGGGPSRLVSGMSIEGFMPEHGLGVSEPGLTPMVVSRNASGLDTMQSIEHALPDGDGQQAA